VIATVTRLAVARRGRTLNLAIESSLESKVDWAFGSDEPFRNGI
jgi:hypothetical protein